MRRGISEVEVLSREGGLGGKERGEKAGLVGNENSTDQLLCSYACSCISLTKPSLAWKAMYNHCCLWSLWLHSKADNNAIANLAASLESKNVSL